MGSAHHRWDSFVAIGDSFTEGLNDRGPNGGFRGWADRTAERLAELNPGFRYANLAVRGKLLHQIAGEQLPLALRAHPTLVTFCAGGNDILRPGTDPDALAARAEQAVRRLRANDIAVVVFTGFDTKHNALLRRLRGKIATYNAHLRAIADLHDCMVVDLWSMGAIYDRQAWSDDRLHLSSAGHRRVALRTCEVLGLDVGDRWDAPWPPTLPADWITLRRNDLRWAREHVVPWIGRRLRGTSSGDAKRPKRPVLAPLDDDDRCGRS